MKNRKKQQNFLTMIAPDASEHKFIASRKQLHRMAAIVAMLKKARWVGMKNIKDELDATEFTAGADLTCGNRTIQRDIKALKEEYSAPIKYSKSERAYSLLDREWSFQAPALLSPEELLAISIGGKIAEDIFPLELSRRVVKAVNEVLRSNKSDVLSAELLSSLKVLSRTVVSGEIFLAVFEAWQKRRVIQISYVDKDGSSVLRDVEPHALVFSDMKWSIKGYCRLRKAQRTFHIGKIRAATLREETFTPSPDIINSVTPDSFFEYEKLENVELLLNEAGKQFAQVTPLHTRQRFLQESDGCHLFVSAVSLEQLIPWVLTQQGNARPLAPVKAVEAIRQSIRNLANACTVYDAPESRKQNRIPGQS